MLIQTKPQLLKFKSAAANDNGKRVTLSVPELCTKFKLNKELFAKGKKFVFKIEGIESLWYVNRDKTTLTTKGFPRGLEKPTVGDFKNYVVSTEMFELGE